MDGHRRARGYILAGMYAWLVVEPQHAELLPAAAARAWSAGGGEVAEVELPVRKGTRPLVFTWIDRRGATAQRPPRWPDLLVEWADIYSEPLFPGEDALAVLAEEMSAMGADALLLHVAPGLAGCTVGWYERGALSLYEHVGGGTVSWTEADGLGRPSEGRGRTMALAGARKLAGAVGRDSDHSILDRIEHSARATSAVLIERALHRFLAADPPPFDELAGLVARARVQPLAPR